MAKDFAETLFRDINRVLEAGRHSAESAFSQDQLRNLVEQALQRAGLVSREEFDAQKAVLLRTRQRLEALEAKLDDIESSSGDLGGSDESESDRQKP